MLLPEFDFHAPTTLSEACEILTQLGGKARLLAGGTDLLVNMKKQLICPEHVVSLSKIEDLTDIVRENGTLRIGPCVTADQLADSETIQQTLAALAEGAGVLGSPLIRNLATIAGNIVSARPAADLPPPLMVYGAKVTLTNATGERSVDLDDFFTGPGQTVMAPDEILTGIVVNVPEGLYGAGYIKLGVRQTLEISLVNVAAFLSLGGKDGPIKTARIVLGSVGPTPVRARSADDLLKGQRPSSALFARAGEAAAQDCTPIDDFRGSAEYRREMVRTLTMRTLNTALNRAAPRK